MKNARSVADFLESLMELVPADQRSPFLEAIHDIRDHRYPSKERLAELTYTLGKVTWPARRALARYAESTDGSAYEWDRVLERCRTSTASALKKLRHALPSAPLDTALRQADAAILIDADREMELALLRPQILSALWREHQNLLAPFIHQAQTELHEIEQRFARMKEEATKSRTQQDLLLSKLATFKDRVYVDGEVLPTEMLDAELQFEREERALPTEDR